MLPTMPTCWEGESYEPTGCTGPRARPGRVQVKGILALFPLAAWSPGNTLRWEEGGAGPGSRSNGRPAALTSLSELGCTTSQVWKSTS